VIALATLPALGFTSCQPRPNVPEQVEVIVEKYRDLPSWATDQLVVPHAIDGSVGARVQSEKERGVTIDLANCHRRLLAKLDKGEAVDKRECDR
jgi:hypothetical protein